MSLTQGLQLPFGIQSVNPVPVDSWSGPYDGVSLQDAIDLANSTIPIEIRFQSMEVRLIVGGVSKKFWYRDGVDDTYLIEFGLGPIGVTGATGIQGPTGVTGATGPTGAPGTTPSLPEVLTIGDRLFETPGIRNFEIADRTKYLLCFGGEILTLNESIINFPVNSLIQFRVLDTEASLQIVGTLCFYLDGVTPLTSITLYAGDYCELKKIDLTNWILTVSSGSNSAIQRGVFSGAFSLNNATRGGEYVPLTQTGALTLSAGVNAVNGGIDTVKITANGSAITVPGGWINIGSDSISVVNGAVNRIMVRQYQSEIWYTVKVS